MIRLVGVFLVALGLVVAWICLFPWIQFEMMIREGRYHYYVGPDVKMETIGLAVMAILLVAVGLYIAFANHRPNQSDSEH